MSSNLKDARWEVAAALAKDDGKDFYEIPYGNRDDYLERASRLLSATDRAIIEILAANFREGLDGD